ncbi:hypothetical protein AXF42_Ash014767 [Apostasia shenzhenica]|uniref:Uncharacterized protein n=1 Tax=Apostasia shenzhenica TaxID=1088818 RepID=A0A2H9ZWA2_9ASPA|nr:hypothetical protein AXF42_Ash014767 [Apostasia shenzhenica]
MKTITSRRDGSIRQRWRIILTGRWNHRFRRLRKQVLRLRRNQSVEEANDPIGLTFRGLNLVAHMPESIGGLPLRYICDRNMSSADKLVPEEEEVPLSHDVKLEEQILEPTVIEIEPNRVIPFGILSSVEIRRCFLLLQLEMAPAIAAVADGNDGVDGGFLEEIEEFHALA